MCVSSRDSDLREGRRLMEQRAKDGVVTGYKVLWTDGESSFYGEPGYGYYGVGRNIPAGLRVRGPKMYVRNGGRGALHCYWSRPSARAVSVLRYNKVVVQVRVRVKDIIVADREQIAAKALEITPEAWRSAKRRGLHLRSQDERVGTVQRPHKV